MRGLIFGGRESRLRGFRAGLELRAMFFVSKNRPRPPLRKQVRQHCARRSSRPQKWPRNAGPYFWWARKPPARLSCWTRVEGDVFRFEKPTETAAPEASASALREEVQPPPKMAPQCGALFLVGEKAACAAFVLDSS